MIIEILYFEHILPSMEIKKGFFDDSVVPVIWNNRGTYKIIPATSIKNKMDLEKTDSILIHWYETHDLDERTARLLLDE